MPIQSNKATDYIFIPDGSKISVKAKGESVYTDLGSIDGDVSCPVEWDDTKIQDNSLRVIKRIKKNFKITGSFNLMDLDPAGLVRIMGGLITKTETVASANSSIPDQVIAAGWADNTVYDLVMYTSSSDSTKLNMGATIPTLTSVTLDAAGTPEVLTANNDYVIVKKPDAVSGYGIQFVSANMSTGSPTTKAITIDYGTNTPVARTTLHMGTSVAEFDAYSIKITHTDSNSKERGIEIYSATTNSGGFAFGMKSALSDGTDVMNVQFTGEIDETLTDGRQLFNWYMDSGAL